MKKFVATLMTIALFSSIFSLSAFAAESDVSASEPEWTTIEIILEPGDSINSIETGIMPLIWENPSYEVSNITYTGQFDVPDRYFAYETSATAANGSAVSGTYSVDLLEGGSLGRLASTSNYANGSSTKNDWLDIGSGRYLFKITNSTTTTLKVTLKYYSWS